MKLKATCEIIYAIDGKRLVATPGSEFDVPADVAKLIHPSAYSVVSEDEPEAKGGKKTAKAKPAEEAPAAPAAPAEEAKAPTEEGVI